MKMAESAITSPTGDETCMIIEVLKLFYQHKDNIRNNNSIL